MRFVLEAEPGEAAAKAHQLIKALALDLAPGSPVAERVLDALAEADVPEREQRKMRDPTIERLRARVQKIAIEELRQLERELVELADEPITKGLEEVDEFEVSDPELVKGLGHKYLRRVATGNPKRPWRYIYSYQGSRSKNSDHVLPPAMVRYSDEKHVKVGDAYRDAALGAEHTGHWHITALDGEKVSIRHDETHEERHFETRSQLRQFIDELHQPGIEATTRAHDERRMMEIKAALKIAIETAERVAEDPSLANLRANSTQWIRVARLRQSLHQHSLNLDELLGTDTSMPSTFKKLRQEIDTLRQEVGRYLPPGHGSTFGDTELIELRDPVRIRKGLRLRYLVDKIGYGYSPGVEHRVELVEVLEKLHGKEVTKETVETAIVGLLREKYRDPKAVTRAKLKGVLIRGQYLSKELLEKYGPLTDPLTQQIAENPKLLLASTREIDKGDSWGRKQLLSTAASEFLSVKPKPETYAGLLPNLSVEGLLRHIQTEEQTLQQTPMSAADAGSRWAAEKIETLSWLRGYLGQGADPVVTVDLPRERPRDPRDPYKPPPTVSAPLSQLLNAFAEPNKQRAERLTKAHSARWAKLASTLDETKLAAGDVQEMFEQAISDAAKAIGLTDEQLADLRKNHPGTTISGFVYGAVKRLHSQAAKLASWDNKDRASYEEATKTLEPIRQKYASELRERVFAQLRARLGIQPNITHGQNRTPVEAETHEVPKLRESLDTMFGILDSSIIPETTIQISDGHARGFASSAGRKIQLYSEDMRGGEVPWHEYGHQIEHQSRGITEAANTLRDQRGAEMPVPRLEQMGGNYEAHEVTYRDQWVEPYTGKWYGHMGSTEVLSMGLQHLVHDPLQLFAQDPQHFYFTLAAVSGRLGKHDG